MPRRASRSGAVATVKICDARFYPRDSLSLIAAATFLAYPPGMPVAHGSDADGDDVVEALGEEARGMLAARHGREAAAGRCGAHDIAADSH